MARRVRRLRPFEADRLREQELTYQPVGLTRGTTYPPGFHHLEVETELGHGDAAFEHAAEVLLTWRMHAGAGLRPSTSSERVGLGEVVRCRLGPLQVPCRVVWVLDEPDAKGFGYGTLPGHPESGEEAFVVRRAPDARAPAVTLSVTAYSRPATALTRLAGPLGRWGQRLVIGRYARALRH